MQKIETNYILVLFHTVDKTEVFIKDFYSFNHYLEKSTNNKIFYGLDQLDIQFQYNKKFDMYLYEEVGYPILNTLTVGLYCSPYGATSIREYFANGFEFFFLKDRELVKQVSPQLY